MDKFLPRKRAIIETIADLLTPYSLSIGSPSTSGDGNHAPSSGDFEVVAPGRTLIVGTLQHVAAHATGRLIIEDNARPPAFQVDSGCDACRAPDGEFRPSATKPGGNHASRLGKLDAKHASYPAGIQFKEIQTAQLGSDLRPATPDHDLPGTAALNEVTFKGATLKNVSFAPPFSLSKKYYSHQDH